MKKSFRISLIIAAMLLMLCGCSRVETPINNIYGTNFSSDSAEVVDYILSPDTKELTYNSIPYTYDVSFSGDSVTYTIYYPNGGTYYETRGSNGGPAGWNNDYSLGLAYASGEELVEFLSQLYYVSHSAPNFGHVVILVVCLALGTFDLLFPYAAWRLSHLFRSWQYESVEPSEAGIIWTRIGGVILMIVGVIGFFSNWS